MDQIQNSEILRYKFHTDNGEIINLMNSPLNVLVVCFKTCFYICQKGETSDKIVTRSNPKGLISIRNQNQETVIAYPNENMGQVNILTKTSQNSTSTLVLPCHRNEIDMLDLSLDCSLVVTASTNGRNIRIFDVKKGGKLI